MRFVFPAPVALPEELAAFGCPDTGSADAEYEICLLSEPLCPPEPPFHVQRDIQIYQTEEGWLRIYSPLITDDGLQVACLLCPDGKNKLFYPVSRWDFFSAPLRCVHLIGGETLLLQHNALLLHSSVVELHGKTVLFSGPSGAGKSTQAALWQQHLGAQVLNGDRCVIRKMPDGFCGGGSPWAGTSGIYRRAYYPIAGIFLVRQAPVNQVQRLGAAAFSPLFSQTVVNSWDARFMEQVLRLFQELLGQVPVYLLSCRPDAEAVRLAHQTLFC